ncbi:MAG: glucose-1-phosphate adenylyltransferase [Ruminococcaceae bacterium]|nr:glucose-1-phosphate adenylyltransferase [Oscillospiraceae bacterium]
MKKEMVAMILAGGQGSRLGALTSHVAKPAVSFGGKYKMIDFVLSNCTNSGVDTVGVLTQYKPLDLNAHIGNGAPWDLDVRRGGISLLPPYMRKTTAEWYRGTANAVYQNLEYLEQYHPEYVLILSGDHIYKMDYGRMLAHHRKKGAEATIAVIDVPQEEAKRFGILNINGDRRVLDFEEKPRHPKSTLASMGVYIFNYDVLRKALIQDNEKERSAHDFGKNIIPSLLEEKRRLYAYPFTGYWRDIGTLSGIWQANLDLLSLDNPLDLYNKDWQIYTRPIDFPPHYIASYAVTEQTMISKGCSVYGTVRRSVIFPNVTIEKGAVVEDSVIMSGCRIGSGVQIKKAILCEQVSLPAGIVIGDGTELAIISPDTQYDQISIAAG